MPFYQNVSTFYLAIFHKNFNCFICFICIIHYYIFYYLFLKQDIYIQQQVQIYIILKYLIRSYLSLLTREIFFFSFPVRLIAERGGGAVVYSALLPVQAKYTRKNVSQTVNSTFFFGFSMKNYFFSVSLESQDFCILI